MPTRSPLDLDQETMRRLGRQVADTVANHLGTLRDQPAYATLGKTEAVRPLAGPPPLQGTEFDSLLRTLQAHVLPHAAREPHPGFMAYVPSCPTFPGVLGDWLATGFNFFAGVWSVGAGPNAVELVVLEWFRQWLGMPDGSRGLLTSGGSAANFTAMIAARHRATGDDAALIPRLTVYTSAHAHSSVMRAAWLTGVPRANVRAIPSDNRFRLRPDALADAIARDRAAGLIPMAVVASAGTTSTGSVDPLPEIGDLCARERVWMHIDAAYGGFAVLTERGRAELDGIGRADSVTLDPHKWLYVPFECGCLLARNPRELRDAFAISADYLRDAEDVSDAVNFSDYGVQLTRYSRALKVWLSVSYFGTEMIAGAIAGGIALAEHGERIVRATAGLEVLSPAQLGILCFRAHPAGMDDPAELDALNERINGEIVSEGRYFISSTRINGAHSLRICVPGYRTTAEEVEGVMAEVVKRLPSAVRS